MARSYGATIKIYRDDSDEFRWRLLGSNGRIIADSAEGYATKQNCEQAVARLKVLVGSARVVESSEALS